jgi:catechol 2,3-dioxygenase
MIKASLNHLHLNVRDLERAVRFYHQALGVVEAFRQGPDMAFLAAGDDLLTLHRAEPVGSRGLVHFGFRIEQGTLEEAIAAVTAAGGSFKSRGRRGAATAYAYVTDPDGYTIELSAG